MAGHSSSVTSLRRHVKKRETPVPVMLVWNCMHLLAQKLLFSIHFLLGCPFHMIDVSQSATISVWICWKSTILKVYLLLPLKHVTLLQKISIDLNARSTKVKKHFHGVSMTTIQSPWKENQGVMQNVMCDLSLLDNNKKLALSGDYEIISEPLYRQKYATFLTSVYNQHRIFELSRHIVEDWICQRNRLAEIFWFKKSTVVFIPFKHFNM